MWAEQYQIEEGGIPTLCRNHHPGFQKWLKGIENQDKEYDKHLANIDRLQAKSELIGYGLVISSAMGSKGGEIYHPIIENYDDGE